MFFSKDSRLSARVFGPVLNFPLYDADCCPAARDCLAVGNVVGAIAEWQRLADLGSGGARCVLAYLHLMGAISTPIDLEEARRIALSAVGGSRGYANYLLGCISLREKRGPEAVKFFLESIKAGFSPAATHLASLLIRGSSEDGKQKAVTLLRKAVAAGHCPALLRLAGAYLSGQLGFTRRVVGLTLLVPAFVRVWLALKYQVFSIQCFQVMAGTTQPLFTEEGQRFLEKTNSLSPGTFRRAIVRWAHAIAAITAAMVLVIQSESVPGQDGKTSAPALGGWALLAAWPYGFSYWIASAAHRLGAYNLRAHRRWIVVLAIERLAYRLLEKLRFQSCELCAAGDAPIRDEHGTVLANRRCKLVETVCLHWNLDCWYGVGRSQQQCDLGIATRRSGCLPCIDGPIHRIRPRRRMDCGRIGWVDSPQPCKTRSTEPFGRRTR